MMRFLCAAFVLCSALLVQALDREAFTFTKYDLNVRVEPEQQRIGVRGKITLRNDSSSPQRSVTLQICSSLNWSSITFQGKPVEFVTQPYISDVDHTGALSEAIVVLPQPVAPKQSVELEVGYEGVISLDVTRLTRIGVPEDTAKHTDWDQIGRTFTAVRGIGYVAWYPIATEAASLEDGDSVEEVIGRWKLKGANCRMTVDFKSTSASPIYFTGTPDLFLLPAEDGIKRVGVFDITETGLNVPTFVIGNYQDTELDQSRLTVRYLPGQQDVAKEYAAIGTEQNPLIPIGKGSANLQVLSLPDSEDASFVSEGMLLMPLKSPMQNDAVLNIVYARARNLVRSPRAWIKEGLARYAEAAYIQSVQNRQAALDYMQAREQALIEREESGSSSKNAPLRSLVNAPDNAYLQTKAMWVWWMLGDMFGGTPVMSMFDYDAREDSDPAYAQHVIEKAKHRGLQWFFDDWVYHDRGLPDFRVVSVYPSELPTGGYMVTVTVENLGAAGAEVPVTAHSQDGERSERLVVRGNSKASVRIQAPSLPQTVTVNDGSVPESDMSNNEYKVNH